MVPRLAGPQVDYWLPLLEKMTIVLACLSSERRLIHNHRERRACGIQQMDCVGPLCYALFEGNQSYSIESMLRSMGSWVGGSSHGCKLCRARRLRGLLGCIR